MAVGGFSETLDPMTLAMRTGGRLGLAMQTEGRELKFGPHNGTKARLRSHGPCLQVSKRASAKTFSRFGSPKRQVANPQNVQVSRFGPP